MKLFNYYLFLALAGTLSFTACSNDDEPDIDPVIDPVVNYNVSLTMTDNGFELASGEKFTPGFTAGAKAGLFAVTNGTVTASNIELTYDGSVWTTDKVIDGGERYFVYTPYKADAASKISADATDAAGFFAGLVSVYAAPGAEQGDFDAAVRPYDIVFAEAAVATGRSESVTEVLSLTAAGSHALAVTSWSLPGGTRYVTSSGFAYSTPDGGKSIDVKLGSLAIIPGQLGGLPAYFHAPGKSDKLTVNYTLNGETKSAEVALGAAAGKQSLVGIGDAPTDGGKRDIAVGDLYYRDGSVLPVEKLADLQAAPAGVAGVVFCVDPARFSADEKSLLGDVHALVISSKMGRFKNRDYMVWCDAYPKPADDGAGRFIDSQEDSKYPGMVLPLIEDHSDAVKSYEANNADINGYSNNKIIRTRRSEEIAAGYYPVFSAIDDLNSNVTVSGASTGWYLPSVGQLMDYMRNIGGANISASVVHALYSAYDDSDFDFGADCSPNLRARLDLSMAKISAGEKDLFTASENNALWSSSYASVFSTYTQTFMPGARQLVYDYDNLFCLGYDVIGKGNVRGVLAF